MTLSFKYRLAGLFGVLLSYWITAYFMHIFPSWAEFPMLLTGVTLGIFNFVIVIAGDAILRIQVD